MPGLVTDRQRIVAIVWPNMPAAYAHSLSSCLLQLGGKRREIGNTKIVEPEPRGDQVIFEHLVAFGEGRQNDFRAGFLVFINAHWGAALLTTGKRNPAIAIPCPVGRK
jgi:hypothetical protein